MFIGIILSKDEYNLMSDKRIRVMLAIELKSISKNYPGVTALENIDLAVKEKSIHGFLGPNGAGKSTTMNIITGLVPATTGDVYILGEQLESEGSSKSIIGHLPENPPLYMNMRVEDYLKFCQEVHECSDRNLLEDVIQKVGLESVRSKIIAHLSKGYKQRVGLAQALVFGASIIILDEPMVGLDPNAVRQMRDLIIELKKEHTILLCTHQLDEAAKVCDEVTIIEKGLVKKTGTIEELRSELAGGVQYIANVSKPTENLKDLIESCEGTRIRKMIEEEGGVTIHIEVNSSSDQRARITRVLANNSDLLSFTLEQTSLEDIFKEVVKK